MPTNFDYERGYEDARRGFPPSRTAGAYAEGYRDGADYQAEVEALWKDIRDEEEASWGGQLDTF